MRREQAFFFHFNLWTTLITPLLCSCTCVAGFLSCWFFGFLSGHVWQRTVLTEASLLRVVLWRQLGAVGKTVASFVFKDLTRHHVDGARAFNCHLVFWEAGTCGGGGIL